MNFWNKVTNRPNKPMQHNMKTDNCHHHFQVKVAEIGCFQLPSHHPIVSISTRISKIWFQQQSVQTSSHRRRTDFHVHTALIIVVECWGSCCLVGGNGSYRWCYARSVCFYHLFQEAVLSSRHICSPVICSNCLRYALETLLSVKKQMVVTEKIFVWELHFFHS